jgi:hypothetical protein
MSYLVYTDRDKLVYIASKFKSPKTNRIDWEKAKEELNFVFSESATTNIWKLRHQRAYNFSIKHTIGNLETLAQIKTEKTIAEQFILPTARTKILTEQVLTLLEASAKPMVFKKNYLNAKQKNEYIFVTSDFHFDGDNNMLESLQKAYDHIINQQKIHKFKRIKLIELGDIVEGSHLRPSQLLAIKSLLIPQTVTVSQAYVEFLHKLTQDLFVDFYCVTSSNHTQTRAFGTQRNELVEDDAMLIFSEIVKTAMFKNKNFKIQSGRDLVANITDGHKMFIAHGHLIEGKKTGYVQELAMARNITFDYALFGHFHHYREVTLYGRDTHNMKVFYAPSMNTKHSDYEFDRNLSSKAGILMMVFNNTTGHQYCQELFV